jgi:hypothetical protein
VGLTAEAGEAFDQRLHAHVAEAAAAEYPDSLRAGCGALGESAGRLALVLGVLHHEARGGHAAGAVPALEVDLVEDA